MYAACVGNVGSLTLVELQSGNQDYQYYDSDTNNIYYANPCSTTKNECHANSSAVATAYAKVRVQLAASFSG